MQKYYFYIFKFKNYAIISINVVGMEMRKVQKLGSSSLAITLPRSWVKRMKIKPGSVVYLVEKNDGVMIKTTVEETPLLPLITVDADKIDEREFLGKLPACFYVLGLDEAIVKSENKLNEELVYMLKASAARLSGIEVIEESGKELRIRTLLDVSRINPAITLRQMSITISKLFSCPGSRVTKE